MPWKELLGQLRDRGWTQNLLRERLVSRGVAVGQATLSDLGAGKTKNPNFDLGAALRELHASGEVAPGASADQGAATNAGT